MVRAKKFPGFVGFWDGDDVGVLPDGGDAGAIEGMVDEVGEEVEAPWAQMLEVPDCQAIRARHRRVPPRPYGLGDLVRGEREGVGAKGVRAGDIPPHSAGVWVVDVGE